MATSAPCTSSLERPIHWRDSDVISDMWRSIDNWDVARWDWWAYPLERNAFKRVVVRGDLNAVQALPDGSQLWVVGSGGLILHSADGGATWKQRNPPMAQSGATRSARGFDWLPSAQAALPPRRRK